MDTEQALAFAKKVAGEAGAIMRANFTLGMKKEWKKDKTPLTETDVAVNQLVLEAVAKQFPSHSYIGEEGSNLQESEYTWVCDPIDGTIPFSHGFPTFAFSLALVHTGTPVVGVIYDPVMDRLLWAEKGKGAYLNGGRISVSSENTISSQSFISANASNRVRELRAMLAEREAWVPTLYSCVYSSMLVAVGEFTAEVYTYTSPWDAAAVKVVVEEAGGKVTDLTGREQRYDRTINGFIASNGRVHDELVQVFKSYTV